jgi:hypothetical protein
MTIPKEVSNHSKEYKQIPSKIGCISKEVIKTWGFILYMITKIGSETQIQELKTIKNCGGAKYWD